MFCGGWVSDKLVKRLGPPARLYLLGVALLIACPFAFGVLFIAPPASFTLLIPYYLFSICELFTCTYADTKAVHLLGETWFSILLVSIVHLVPENVKTSVIGIFLFLMNNVGGNLPVLVDPLTKLIGYRETLVIFFPTMQTISKLYMWNVV